MSYDRSWQRTTTTRSNGNNRRGPGRYVPPPPPGSHNRQHSVFGYWIPLIGLSTIAVGGLAAWIWSERNSHEDEYPHEKPPRPSGSGNAAYPGSQGPFPSGPQSGPPLPQGYSQPEGGAASTYYNQTTTQTSRDTEERTDQTFIGRMGGIIKRTPSPQKIFDSASKGVAAAGAAAGAALSSIMEEDQHGFASYDDQGRHELRAERRQGADEREGFSDHERWSEEAEDRSRTNRIENESSKRIDTAQRDSKNKGRPRRTIAVVVSADSDYDHSQQDDNVFHAEHGSILAHLPHQHDPTQTELFVLIYSPGLQSLPPVDYIPARAPSTMGSSYSHIDTPAVTPGSELQSISPQLAPTTAFDAIYNQALSLVSDPTRILPFTTPDGYVSLLRHLSPKLVYISDALSGHQGETVAQLKGWVGHTILVAGDEGHGHLADTETETEDERRGSERKEKGRWYDNSPLVGLGKEVEVVDAARVGDDWARRVFGRE